MGSNHEPVQKWGKLACFAAYHAGHSTPDGPTDVGDLPVAMVWVKNVSQNVQDMFAHQL